jgi:hypothetical protein
MNKLEHMNDYPKQQDEQISVETTKMCRVACECVRKNCHWYQHKPGPISLRTSEGITDSVRHFEKRHLMPGQQWCSIQLRFCRRSHLTSLCSVVIPLASINIHRNELEHEVGKVGISTAQQVGTRASTLSSLPRDIESSFPRCFETVLVTIKPRVNTALFIPPITCTSAYRQQKHPADCQCITHECVSSHDHLT